MKLKNRIITFLLSAIMIFTGVPITAHADDIVTYDKWKLEEAAWPKKPSENMNVDFVFTYTEPVATLAGRCKSVNDSCFHAWQWLEDVYYYNEIVHPAEYTDLDNLIKSARNSESIATNGYKESIIDILNRISKDSARANYNYNIEKSSHIDKTTVIKLINNGQGFTDGSSEEAHAWLAEVETYFKNKSGFASKDIMDALNSVKNLSNIDTGKCRDKIIGYMISLISLPTYDGTIYQNNKAIVTGNAILTEETAESATFTATATFNGNEYADVRVYDKTIDPPIVKTVYKVIDVVWTGGSLTEAPSKAEFTLQDEANPNAEKIVKETTNISMSAKNQDGTYVQYEAFLFFNEQILSAHKEFRAPEAVYKVQSAKWNGSFNQMPTSCEMTIRIERGSDVSTKTITTKTIKLIDSTSSSKTYEASLLYETHTLTATITYKRPSRTVTLSANDISWDLTKDGTIKQMWDRAKANVSYNGSGEAYPISGPGIDIFVDGPGKYTIVWECTEGLQCTQVATITGELIIGPPMPPASIEDPFNPAPSITAFTTDIYLVKGQKFDIGAFTLVNSTDSEYFKISKKNIATAKKATGDKEVLIINGTQKIAVHIEESKLTKKMTLDAGKVVDLSTGLSDKYNIFWYSSNPDAVLVDKDGTITALNKGTSTISACVNGSRFNCVVKVKEPTISSNRLLHINVNSSKTIKIKGLKGWMSSDNTIVSVKGNKIKALKTGTVTLTTYKDGNEYNIKVFVEDPSIVNEGVTLSKKTYKIVSATNNIIPLEFASIEMSRPIIFKSNNPSVAYVNSNQEIVVTDNAGKATLTAKVNGKTIKIKVESSSFFTKKIDEL